MKKIISGLGGVLLCGFLISCLTKGTLGEPKEVCQKRNQSYNIPDSEQCDSYHDCTKAGKLLPRLCEDGFVFSEEIRACDYPHNVNCSGRELLQEPKSIGDPHCERMNGFYPFPPEESCQKFYHCLEGTAYEKTCPEGVIFDPSKGACIHPDMSHRPDCAARSVLNFTCPNYNKKFVRLRFGDHDRLPHLTNCRKFFICLHDGKPRVGGCPLGKVFNPKIGVCDSPKRVPQCKDYYGKKDLAKLAKLAELGEEASLEEEEFLEQDISDEEGDSSDEEQQENEAISKSKNANANKGKKFHSKREATAHAPEPSAQQQQPAAQQQQPAATGDSSKNEPSQTSSSQSQFDSDEEEDSEGEEGDDNLD